MIIMRFCINITKCNKNCHPAKCRTSIQLIIMTLERHKSLITKLNLSLKNTTSLSKSCRTSSITNASGSREFFTFMEIVFTCTRVARYTYFVNSISYSTFNAS